MASSRVLLLLVPLLVVLAAASHHRTPASARAPLHHLDHGRHHRSPSTMTATTRVDTTPSKRHNHHEPEASHKQLVPYHATRVAEWSASEVSAPPPVDEPAATTTTVRLPNPYHAAGIPPLPLHGGPAGLVAWGGDQGLAMVLTSLGYSEMGSAAALLDDSSSVKRWPGVITIFAAPDIFLHVCPGCSRRHLLLQHMALGYYSYSELAAAPAVRIPSASVGFCLHITAAPTPSTVHHVSLYVDGVKVSHPDLYNDGRYVVHGIYGVIPPLTSTSSSEGPPHHRHHLIAIGISAASSSTTAASLVRIKILEAISQLRHGGFGFVALAMDVKFSDLEKLSNLTVFALEDEAIFATGGHDYVASVLFHIVPNHRLTYTDLLRLHDTALPTMAGDGQKLVITTGSVSDEIRINYMPMKNPDAVVNSHVAVHGIYASFPRLHLAPSSIETQMHGICRDGDCSSMIWATQHNGVSGVDSGDEQQHANNPYVVRSTSTRADDPNRVATKKPSRGRHGGLCHCLVSHFHSTGLTYWKIVMFPVKYGLKISWLLVSTIALFMSVLSTYLMVHWEIASAIGIPLAAAIVFMTLPDAPNIGRLVDKPIDQEEYENSRCGCGKQVMFRLSHEPQWFCPACLEGHIVLNYCAHEANPAPSLKRFQIWVFGDPIKVLGLDEYPDLHHIYPFPSWYISEVAKNWYKGEVRIEYTSFDDIRKLKKPRKRVVVYETWPRHRVLRGNAHDT